MRVDAYNKVSQIYQANSTQKTSKANAAVKSDKLEISQAGRDYHIAKQAVAAAPDVRMDKVNDIRQRMEAGTYNISAEEVAHKLAESYFNASI